MPDRTIFTDFCDELVKFAAAEIYPVIWQAIDRARTWRNVGVGIETANILKQRFENKETFGITIGKNTYDPIELKAVKNKDDYRLSVSLDIKIYRMITEFCEQNLPRPAKMNVKYMWPQKIASDPLEAAKYGSSYIQDGFHILIRPMGFTRGFFRSIFDDTISLESSTDLTILYNGTPIVGLIARHNGDMIVTDGSNVRRCRVDKFLGESEGVITRDNPIAKFPGDVNLDAYHGTIYFITKGSPKTDEMLNDKMSLYHYLSGSFKNFKCLDALGTARLFELVHYCGAHPNALGISQSGADLDRATIGALTAIITNLGGHVCTKDGSAMELRDPRLPLSRILYGSADLLLLVKEGIDRFSDLSLGNTISRINEARLACLTDNTAIGRGAVLILHNDPDDIKRGHGRGIFREHGFKALIEIGQYLRAIQDNFYEAKGAELLDFIRMANSDESPLRRQITPASHPVLVTRKEKEDKNAQAFTSADVTADEIVQSRLAHYLEKAGIVLLSEESPKPSEEVLKEAKFMINADGIDNTGAFIEKLCLILGIPHVYYQAPITSDPTQNHVTSNMAFIEDGQPTEGMLLCPYRKQPALYRTENDKDGKLIVKRITLDKLTGEPAAEKGGFQILPQAEYENHAKLICKIGQTEEHIAFATQAVTHTGKFQPAFQNSGGQERITDLLEGRAQLVFNNKMMSWDIGASVALSRALGYDVAILPENMNDIMEKAEILDFRTAKKMSATVIGHPQLLRDMGLIPQLDLIAQRDRGEHLR